jgi:hypothetical protein
MYLHNDLNQGKLIVSSPALKTKIAQARAFAPHELPKARLCANVILAALDGENAMESAVLQLKQGLGNNWSPITALQFKLNCIWPTWWRSEFAAMKVLAQ